MSAGEKLIAKLKRNPSTIAWRDVEKVLRYLGYVREESRKGSGVKFINRETGHIILFHKPHPENEICGGAKDSLIRHLQETGVFK